MVLHQTKEEFSSLLICSMNEGELLRTPIDSLNNSELQCQKEPQCVQVDLTRSHQSNQRPNQESNASITTPLSYKNDSFLVNVGEESGQATKSWDEYSVVSILGEGSYGKVYKAKHR